MERQKLSPYPFMLRGKLPESGQTENRGTFAPRVAYGRAGSASGAYPRACNSYRAA